LSRLLSLLPFAVAYGKLIEANNYNLGLLFLSVKVDGQDNLERIGISGNG